MGAPKHQETAKANLAQGENLSGFLHRINFSLDCVESSPRKALSSLNGGSTDGLASKTPTFPFTFPPLQDKTNQPKQKPKFFNPPAENVRERSPKDTIHLSEPSPTPHSGSQQDLQKAPVSVRPQASKEGIQTTSSNSVVSSVSHTPNAQHSDKPQHLLPVYALAQTLRASSIGATMAPGITNDSSGLGWSKYAPTDQADHDDNSKPDINQRTADTIARQAAIDARLSKLRSRRDPVTEERDETRRHQLVEAEKAAAEKQARLRADRDRDAKKKAEDEASRLHHEKKQAERLKREKEEAERAEAERIKREQEEAERLRREQEEAERLKREQEEAERLKREQEEAARLEAELLQREKEEAERAEMERIQLEKEEAEEAALCAMLHEKIDEIEEEGLTEAQREQKKVDESIKKAIAHQEDILTKLKDKKTEIDGASKILKRHESEYQELKDKEASIIAQLEADTKKFSELQAFSGQIMERANNMRKKVEDKSARSVDMLKAFAMPEDTSSQALKRSELAPKYGKTLFGDQSPATSSKTPSEATEKPTEAPATTKPNDVTADKAKVRENGSTQDKVIDSRSDTTEEGEIKEPAKAQAQPARENANRENKDFENQLKFEEWPSQESRPFGGAQKRLVKLTNLPLTATIDNVQSLVWGGRVEKLDYIPGTSFAWVLFMRGEDCEKYFSDTANGIDYPGDSNCIIWVEMGEPVSVNEMLRGLYDAGNTRCVRAVGADEDWGQTALIKLATAKGRKLERIVNGKNPTGLRVIEFRFTNIVDASRFKVELQNDIDWEHCNVYFGGDPCATNTGVHLGIH
ncbi:hypothetical protein GTA08_BOTSDO00554 [Neofusicoccum parvum]|nr:hypothetical protein GTA08_BOTSDO00554 [Neofusicoccum parvum]